MLAWHHTIDSKKATEFAASCNTSCSERLRSRFKNIENHKRFKRSESIGVPTLFKNGIYHIT